MIFVFFTLIVFFGVFFWNADKLNRAAERNASLRRSAERRAA